MKVWALFVGPDSGNAAEHKMAEPREEGALEESV